MESEIISLDSDTETLIGKKEKIDEDLENVNKAVESLAQDVAVQTSIQEKNQSALLEQKEDVESKLKESVNRLEEIKSTLNDLQDTNNDSKNVVNELIAIGEDMSASLAIIEERQKCIDECTERLQSIMQKLGLSENVSGNKGGGETVEYQDYKKGFFSKNNITRDYAVYSEADAIGLNEAEVKTIQYYTGNGYEKINPYLYDPNFEPKPWEIEKLNNEVQTLTDCLDHKHLERNAELYRGTSDVKEIFGDDAKYLTPDQLIEKYTGKLYRSPAFTSTSCDKEEANSFATYKYGKTPALLTIHAPKGTKGMCVGNVSVYHKMEGEVLLQRGTVYRIDKIAYVNDRFEITVTARGNAR